MTRESLDAGKLEQSVLFEPRHLRYLLVYLDKYMSADE